LNGDEAGSSYFVAMGTSMATPHAAGMAALLLEERPWLDADQLRESILLSGREVESPTTAAGFGLINAVRAFDLMPTAETTTLAHDDGSYEEEILAEAGETLTLVQRFTPPSYPATLSEVLIHLPYSTASRPSMTLLSGALESEEVIDESRLERMVTAVRNTGELLSYNIPDLTITSGDFLVGYAVESEEEGPVASFDTDVSAGKTYRSTGSGEEFVLFEGNLAIRARLAATGAEPVPDVAIPLTFTLGVLDVALSETATTTVTNRGSAPLTLHRVVSDNPEFEVVAPTDSMTLAVGESTEVEVRFAPENRGVRRGTLRIISDDPGEPVTAVAITGEGRFDPQIEVSVEEIDFGDVRLGERGETRVTIRNAGTTVLSVEARITGFRRARFDHSVPEEGFLIAPGSEEEVLVGFTPDDLDSETATFRIESNDEDEGRLTVRLTGQGLGVPVLTVEDESVEFGQVELGQSVERSLVLRNDGTATLSVELATETDGSFVVYGGPFEIAPNSEVAATVEFIPTRVGDVGGSITLNSNDSDAPEVSIPLRGEGTGPQFLRGDCNSDGELNISDASCALNWLFLGTSTPLCTAATNANGDAASDISDATYILGHLFLGGPPPTAPFPDCGLGANPSDLTLGCEESTCQ
ncbi:MAG: choice-of-anchor D domain-containing protein, partial [Planctomycetota bacterium]